MNNIRLSFLCFVCFMNTMAQELVLEHPKIPTPKKELLFFLNGSYFLNINNYNGNIISVIRKQTVFNQNKTVNYKSIDTLFSDKPEMLLLNSYKITDKIGVDSIVQKSTNEFELYTFDKEVNHLWGVYKLKNNEITEYNYNGAVTYTNTKYNYDENKNISKIITINDYGLEEAVFCFVDKNKKLLTKQVLKKLDGFLYEDTNYTYANNLLTEILVTEKHYNTKFTELIFNHLHHMDVFKLHKGSNLIFEKYNFSYNENKQLIKFEKEVDITQLSTFKKQTFKESYIINHQKNKIIVQANSTNPTQYEYFFDRKGNPIKELIYKTNNNQRWLYKQTNFKITYL